MVGLYGGKDPRDIPAYSIGDAARYLRIPEGTVRSWTVGRTYPASEGTKQFKPVIPISGGKPRLLSFTNLIEVHVLRAIRHHQIELDKVRKALDYLEEEFQVSHPLARESFKTDGVDLFIKRYGQLINALQQGQIELKDNFNEQLKRIEPDDTGLAIELYPFTRSDEIDNPRIVMIDPRVSFGRPVIADTGIPTRMVAERYRAGDSIDSLAYDYNCERLKIEEAIRCEMPRVA